MYGRGDYSSKFNPLWLKVLRDGNFYKNDSVLSIIDSYWFQYDPTDMWIHITFSIFVAIVATGSTVGNALVVYVYLRIKSLRSIGAYTTNLAFSDLLSPLLTYYLFTATSYYQIWIFGKLSCELYGFIQGFFGLMSIVTLAVISAERCYVILKPFKAKDIRHKHRCVGVLLIWIYCFTVASPPLFGWSRYAPAGFLTSCCFDYLTGEWLERSFLLYLFVFGFTIPVIIIVTSYTLIFFTVYKSESQSVTKHAGGTMSSAPSGTENGTKNSSGPHRKLRSLTSAPYVKRQSSSTGRNSMWWKKRGKTLSVGEKKQNSVKEKRSFRKKARSGGPEKDIKKQIRKDVQMMKVMLIVILTFVLAWTPYAFVALFAQFGPKILSPFAAMAPAIFAKTSTLYNPAIYAYKDPKFRAGLKALFPCFSKLLKRKKSVDSQSGISLDSEPSRKM